MSTVRVDAWVERLVRHARSGEPLDLARDGDDDEATTRDDEATAGDPRDGVADNAEARSRERHIPATAIRRALLDPDLRPDPRGLVIRGARITGALDLAHAAVPCPLVLRSCVLGGALNAEDAQLIALDLGRTVVTTVNLDGAVLRADLRLNRLRATREVRAVGIRIGGHLLLREAVLTDAGGTALSLDRARVDGSAFLTALRATGTVRANGAHVAGQLTLREAVLATPGGNALSLDGAFVGGLFLTDVQATGKVRALGAHITGQLNLGGAVLSNPAGDALSLDRAEVDGSAFLTNLRATGRVRALGAHITGQLTLRGAVLQSADGDALVLDGVRVDRGIFMTRMQATGEVRALGAHVTGHLDLSGAVLDRPGGDALSLDRARVDGGATLSRLRTTGTVRAPGATVTGQLDLAGAVLSNPGDTALNLQGLDVEVLVLGGLLTDGTLDLTLSTVGTLVTNTGVPATPGGRAAPGADSASSPETAAQEADAERRARRAPARAAALPGPLAAAGWNVGDVHGPLRHDRRASRDWLDTAKDTVEDFSVQPWHELAAVYERNGQPADGRWLRFTAARRVTRRAPWYSKPIRWSYALVAGYGYYPLIAAAWLVAAAVATLLLTSVLAGSFVPTDLEAATGPTRATTTGAHALTGAGSCSAVALDYPCFRPTLYALEVMLPVTELGQVQAWAPLTTGALPHVLIVLRATVWIMTALLLAGVTGLLRRT
ncbi:hypothetical protein V2J56_03770 [Georgenia sp. MJ206]|uniref:hypothetical protein n=1 Tax=Georgenia wangjunii TaxID=3117730 RepID=UPI002F264289